MKDPDYSDASYYKDMVCLEEQVYTYGSMTKSFEQSVEFLLRVDSIIFEKDVVNSKTVKDILRLYLERGVSNDFGSEEGRNIFTKDFPILNEDVIDQINFECPNHPEGWPHGITPEDQQALYDHITETYEYISGHFQDAIELHAKLRPDTRKPGYPEFLKFKHERLSEILDDAGDSMMRIFQVAVLRDSLTRCLKDSGYLTLLSFLSYREQVAAADNPFLEA